MFRPTLSLSGQWRWLALLSWRVDPETLRERVPYGTSLDLWRGEECYLSVIGLRFLDLAVQGLPVPLHRSFLQLNLRFYVRRAMEAGEVRHGATFLRELVPRPLVALAATTLVNEPFATATLTSRIEPVPENGAEPRLVEYGWTEPGGGGRLHLEIRGPRHPLPPDSLEEFIAERCWGYTPQRDGSTLEYAVRHPRWNVWDARADALEGDVAAAFGDRYVPLLAGPPDHAFLAEGSPVSAHVQLRVLRPGH